MSSAAHQDHHVAPINGPIDRLALANSLFGTGDVELCLEILAKLEIASFSRADQIWMEYLTANCHRKAGRLDEARKHYRRIIAMPDADWIGAQCRWWLLNLDERARLQADYRKLADTLSNWEKELDKLVTSRP